MHGIINFSMAITRRPSHSAVNGLRAVDCGQPNIERMLADHAEYCSLLENSGAKVVILPALPAFPDAQFVEDTALCLPEGVIFMSPGAPSRTGEVVAIIDDIEHLFADVQRIEPPAYIEGGDILVTGKEILVGTSARTNEAGIKALTGIAGAWGYNVRSVQTPDDVLHFKTDCALLAPETVLSTPRLSASGCFKDYKIIHTAEGEEAAANAIRFNDIVIMVAGFAKTRVRLEKAGFNVQVVNNDECAKIDGGMSCLSLRLA